MWRGGGRLYMGRLPCGVGWAGQRPKESLGAMGPCWPACRALAVPRTCQQAKSFSILNLLTEAIFLLPFCCKLLQLLISPSQFILKLSTLSLNYNNPQPTNHFVWLL
jgi:hypothetical protein